MYLQIFEGLQSTKGLWFYLVDIITAEESSKEMRAQVKSSQVKSGQVRSGQVKSSQVKSSQVKSS